MISNKGTSLVLTLAAFIAAAGAVDQHQQKSPKLTFNVEYRSGSLNLKPGTWLKVALVTTESYQGTTKPIVVQSEQVTSVQFNTKAEKDSLLLEQMPRSGCAYARSLIPRPDSQPQARVLVFAEASPGAISRFAERLNRRHAIRLVWNDNGSEKTLLLAASDCEYAALLANLRPFLGYRWQKVAAELK